MDIYDRFFNEWKSAIYDFAEKVANGSITIEEAFELSNNKRDELVYKYQNIID
jgi:hypothetical protein